MFQVGQEIIAIRSHIQNYFKKGDIFLVKGVRDCGCSCNDFLVDIGYRIKDNYQTCGKCHEVFFHRDNIGWVGNKYFVPVEEGFAEMVLEELRVGEKELIRR